MTRAEGTSFTGTIYDVFRNDALDTRNYFLPKKSGRQAESVLARSGWRHPDRPLVLLRYYEGFRNHQGITTSASADTAEKSGDFSGSRLSAHQL